MTDTEGRCEKHNYERSDATLPPFVCPKCKQEEQLEFCKQGYHHMAPPRGWDGMRWCYGCGKTVDPDDYFAEAIGSLVQKFRK